MFVLLLYSSTSKYKKVHYYANKHNNKSSFANDLNTQNWTILQIKWFLKMTSMYNYIFIEVHTHIHFL